MLCFIAIKLTHRRHQLVCWPPLQGVCNVDDNSTGDRGRCDKLTVTLSNLGGKQNKIRANTAYFTPPFSTEKNGPFQINFCLQKCTNPNTCCILLPIHGQFQHPQLKYEIFLIWPPIQEWALPQTYLRKIDTSELLLSQFVSSTFYSDNSKNPNLKVVYALRHVPKAP